MDEQKPQSEVERLRAELIEHWEYGNKIPRVFSESLAAFETAIRAESAGEIKQIEGFEELVESSNAVNAELEKVVAALDKMDIPQFKDFDALSAHERIQALSRIIEDTRDEIGRLEQEQPAPAFQGTPTPEQIEAHAKRFPITDRRGNSFGGWWLRIVKPDSLRSRPYMPQPDPCNVYLKAEGGKRYSWIDNDPWRWMDTETFWRDEDFFWLPLQPNGIPVGMSAKVEPAADTALEERVEALIAE